MYKQITFHEFYNILNIYMGQIITQFTYQRRSLSQVQFISDKSLSKIEEFYAKYKAISDSFAIDDTQFKDIFGISHPIFDLLDTRKNLLIDGLQLFAGMAIFSKAVKFDHKIQFIFKLFDFNELNSLSITDLQFMLLSCCSVVHKLLGIKDPLMQQEVIDYVHQQFHEEGRINISEIKKWANSSQILKKFLLVVHNFNLSHKVIYGQKKESLFSTKIYRKQSENNQIIGSIVEEESSIKKNQFQKWLYSASDYFQLKQNNQQLAEYEKYYNCDVYAVPQWIYGLRYKDLKYFIDFINENEIAYLIGKTVVILNLKSNKQRHYLEHQSSIIAITHKNKLVATSQDVSKNGKLPQIRIWNSQSLCTLGTLNNLNNSGIHLIRFSNCCNYLITATNQYQSGILIYQIKNRFQLKYSCYLEFPAVEISTTYHLIQQNCEDFVVASLYSLKCFSVSTMVDNRGITILENQIVSKRAQNQSYMQYLSAITCCSMVCMNKNLKYLSKYEDQIDKKIITGHQDGQVNVWSFHQKCLLFQLTAQESEITKILPHTNYVLISSNSSHLNFWDIDLDQKNKIQTVDVTTLVTKAHAFQVADVIHDYNDNFLITSLSGDLIRMKRQRKKENTFRNQIFGYRYQAKLIRNIINLGEEITFHKVMQLQKYQILLLATAYGEIITINTQTHTVIMKWKIGEKIICFDCYQSQQGDLQIIAATSQRRIYFNSNLLESPKKLQMQKNIKCIKYCSESLGILAVGLQDSTLHFINITQSDSKLKQVQNYTKKSASQNNMLKNLYEFARGLNQKKDPMNMKQNSISQVVNPYIEHTKQITLKKLKLISNVNQVTVLDKKMILFMTEDNKLYLLSLKDYFYKVIDEENKISSSLFRISGIESFYTLKRKGKFYKIPFILGPHLKFVTAGWLDGSLDLWKNKNRIMNGNLDKYQWHNNICSSITISQNQSILITCGSTDGMIVQSSVKYFFCRDNNIISPNKAIISSQVNYEIDEDIQSWHEQIISDDLLERQIMFSTFQNQITTQKYDQHLLVRGLQDETLRKLLKNMRTDWKSVNNICDYSKTPNLSLKLEHVFGVQTYNKRNTIITLNNPLRIIYFVQNVVIIYNPPQNYQTIYRGHRYKVSCIAKFNENLIVSGQAAYQASIHLWDIQTLETIRKIRTNHTLGIINLCTESDYLLSYGVCDIDRKIFCIQFHQVSSGVSVGHKKVQQIIYSMGINPLRNNQFVTCTDKSVIFWKLGKSPAKNFQGNIEKQSEIEVQSPITACFYSINSIAQSNNNYSKNSILEDEIVFGTKAGSLGVIVSKFKLITINKKAHSKQFNCLTFINYSQHQKPSQKLQTFLGDDPKINCSINAHLTKNIKYIVSCSQDQTIKIWNRQFELLYEKDIRKIDFEESKNYSGISSSCLSNYSDKITEKNVSAQSISPIIPINNQQQKDKNAHVNGLFIIFGMRNGDIMILKDHEQVLHNFEDSRGKFRQSRQRRSLMKRNRSSKKTSFRKSRLIQLNQENKRNPQFSVMKTNSNRFKQIIPDTKQKLKTRQQKIKRQSLTFYLLLRNHSSQKSPNINSDYMINNNRQDKSIFTHHPHYQLIVTISSDQNLLLWDTQRNILIMSRALSFMAEPTAIKFSRDGQVLIIGHSDGSILILDFMISDINQGKTIEKYMLPNLKILKKIKQEQACAVLNIEISDNGDYMAVSYNNKINKDNQKILSGSHLKLFANKSRQKKKKTVNNRLQFNDIYQLKSKIPCQKVQSHYVTSQANKYGMAAYWMMFTESQAKTYLLIYEQLVDSNHKRLNYTKNGIYTLWDVNNSTFITTIDSSILFNWKKLYISNSIYCKYQLYSNLTANDHSKLSHQEMGLVSKEKGNKFYNSQSLNSNLIVPYMSAMLNIVNHMILGSVNGDLHLAQISCLDYEQMLEHFPSKNEMFAAKTFPGHCSQINHLELNNNKNILYSGSVNNKSVFKWKIQGNQSVDISNTNKDSIIKQKNQIQQTLHVSKKENQLTFVDNSDIFGETPTNGNIQALQKLYNLKNDLRTQKLLKFSSHNLDYKDYIKIVSVIGRKAHDTCRNLFYDTRKQLVYSSGHSIINSQLNQPNSCKLKKKMHFLHISKENQSCQQVNLIQVGKSRKIVFSCHKGLRASICIWQIFTKIKMKTITFENLSLILQLRISDSQATGVVYGLNLSKQPILMMVDFNTELVLGLVNFLSQPIWQIKELIYVPNHSHKFATCSLNQVYIWSYHANQLVYESLASPFQQSKAKSINLCIQFTKMKQMVVTGCEDGSLAVWGNNKHSKKDHSDMLTILKSAPSNILLGGSKDGFVLLWLEQNNSLNLITKVNVHTNFRSKILFAGKSIKTIDKKKIDSSGTLNKNKIYDNLDKKNLYETIDSIQSLDLYPIFNVQTEEIEKPSNTPNFKQQPQNIKKRGFLEECLDEDSQAGINRKKGKWLALIGTKNGSIYQIGIQKKIHYPIEFEDSPKSILQFYDQQIPKAFFFSLDDSYIFEITNEGHFFCRKIADLSVIFQHCFKMKTIDMLFSMKTQKFFCIFEKQIKILTFELGSKSSSQPSFSIKLHSKIQINFITHATLSSNGRLLGVCHKKNSDNSIIVITYDISQSNQPKKLLEFYVGNNEEVEFIDFSRNNKIILVKMTNGKFYIKDMFKTENIIKQDAIRFIQWNDSAKKLFDLSLKILYKIQNGSQADKIQEFNKEAIQSLTSGVLKIQEISDNVYLLADYYGNIYIYQKTGQLIDKTKLRITQSSMVRLSKSKRLLAVGSQIDRNIMIFDISLCLSKQ